MPPAFLSAARAAAVLPGLAILAAWPLQAAAQVVPAPSAPPLWGSADAPSADTALPPAGGESLARLLPAGTTWRLLQRSVYDERRYQDGQVNGAARNAYLPRAQRSHSAREWGYGLMGSLESGYTPGVVGLGFDVHVDLAQALGGNDYTAGKARLLAVDDQGYLQDHIARAGAAFKVRFASTVLRVGEQRVKSPVFSSSDSRLLPESMRGWLLTHRSIDGLALQAGHFTGSTDRNARRSNNPLTVNYAGAAQGRAFDFVGGTYTGLPNLAATLYTARYDDNWRTHYAGASYTLALAGRRSLAFDAHVYRSTDTGRARSGRIDNTTGSLTASLRQGAHKLSLGYQKVHGDTPFDYVSRGAIWLGNAMQLSDFNAPHEASWQLGYQYDFAAWGLPGLVAAAAYVRGSGIDGSRTDPSGAYAGLGYGVGGKHWERDLMLRYTVQQGRAKGLALSARYDVHRANAAQAELNANRIRLAAEWPLGGTLRE